LFHGNQTLMAVKDTHYHILPGSIAIGLLPLSQLIPAMLAPFESLTIRFLSPLSFQLEQQVTRIWEHQSGMKITLQSRGCIQLKTKASFLWLHRYFDCLHGAVFERRSWCGFLEARHKSNKVFHIFGIPGKRHSINRAEDWVDLKGFGMSGLSLCTMISRLLCIQMSPVSGVSSLVKRT
jgi:hypothetical protein